MIYRLTATLLQSHYLFSAKAFFSFFAIYQGLYLSIVMLYQDGNKMFSFARFYIISLGSLQLHGNSHNKDLLSYFFILLDFL